MWYAHSGQRLLHCVRSELCAVTQRTEESLVWPPLQLALENVDTQVT